MGIESYDYNHEERILSWDTVPSATGYYVEYKKEDAVSWEFLYEGQENQCPFDKPAGRYVIRGKSKPDPGEPGLPRIIVVPE